MLLSRKMREESRVSDIHRREFLTSVAAGVAIGSTSDGSPAARSASSPQGTPPGLAAHAFRPLGLGEIAPAGWLQRQLWIQADGLSGHLDRFWPNIAQSQWGAGVVAVARAGAFPIGSSYADGPENPPRQMWGSRIRHGRLRINRSNRSR